MNDTVKIAVEKTALMKNGTELVIRTAMPEDAKAVLRYLNLVGGESDNLTFGAGEFWITEDEERHYLERSNCSNGCRGTAGNLTWRNCRDRIV